MSDIYKAMLHILLGVLCALFASAEKTEMFWVVWFALSSLINFWGGIGLFIGEEGLF